MLPNLVAVDCWVVIVAGLTFGCDYVVFRSSLCLGIWLVALVLVACCWALVLLFGFACGFVVMTSVCGSDCFG